MSNLTYNGLVRIYYVNKKHDQIVVGETGAASAAGAAAVVAELEDNGRACPHLRAMPRAALPPLRRLRHPSFHWRVADRWDVLQRDRRAPRLWRH